MAYCPRSSSMALTAMRPVAWELLSGHLSRRAPCAERLALFRQYDKRAASTIVGMAWRVEAWRVVAWRGLAWRGV
jgi:hypothetical protein